MLPTKGGCSCFGSGHNAPAVLPDPSSWIDLTLPSASDTTERGPGCLRASSSRVGDFLAAELEIDPWTRFDNQSPYNSGLDTSFEKMKLLVFRCNRLKSLTSFDGSDDCTSGGPFRKQVALEADGCQIHSDWNHIAVFYAMFGMCDCILIETSLERRH
jgi:hypothetical protein